MAQYSHRDEDSSRNISPKRFEVKLKFLSAKERLAKAQEEAKILLSSGEKNVKRPPFVFRAH